MNSVWKWLNQALWQPPTAIACSAEKKKNDSSGCFEDADLIHLTKRHWLVSELIQLVFLKWISKVTMKNGPCFLDAYWSPNQIRTSVWRNNLKSYLEDFCPPRFSATGFFFFFFRWKEGDEKIRCQVWKKVNMNANYPQSKTNPYPEGGEEGGGDVIWMLSWRFDIWEERDFKKWTLINQWMVSNQTSKPSMQKG